MELEEGWTAPAQLIAQKNLQPLLAHLFPSKGSLDWEIRQHKTEYIAAGAMLLIAGRFLIDVRKFEATALLRGARNAAATIGAPPPPAPLSSIPTLNQPLRAEDARMDILAHANAFDGCPGVYFLVLSNEIVYVGQSRNVYSRVNNHKNNDIAFDKWTFIPCAERDLLSMEAHYIAVLRPKLNLKRKPE